MEMINFENKLISIYDYIAKHKDEEQFKKEYDLYIQRDKKADDLFAFITNCFDFNKLPKVASKGFDFSKFRTMYRGAPKKTYHANLLVDTSDRYFGTGVHGNGIYCTSDKDLADFYMHRSNGGDTMEMFLMTSQVTSSKMLQQYSEFLRGGSEEFKEIQTVDFLNNSSTTLTSEYSKQKLEALKAFLDSIKDTEIKEKYLHALERDLSKLAIILGYDAITVFPGKDKSVIVLNRNKITVSKQEYDRIYDKEEKILRPFKPQNEICLGY